MPRALLAAWVAFAAAGSGAVQRGSVDEFTELILAPASTDQSARVRAIRQKLAQRRYQEAESLADILIRSEANNAEGYFWRGYAQLQQNELYSAVQSLREAERLRIRGNTAAKALAICYALVDQYRLFRMKMEEAAALDPNDFAPHYLLGSDAARNLRCADARLHLENALQRNPADYLSHYYLGYCEETAGRIEEARREYELATAARDGRSGFGFAHAGLSRLALQEDDLQRALTHARRAVDTEPASAESRMLLGQVLMKTGDVSAAIAQFRAAISLEATASAYYYLLYQCYLRTGDRSAAQATLAHLKKVLAYYGESQP